MTTSTPARRRRGLWALAAGGVLVLAACGGDDSGSDTTAAPQTTAAPAPTEAPATTAPTATAAPTTEPAATEAPTTTAAPVTEPPATEPPATDPPATEPPATDPPATDPPAAPLQILVTNDDGVGAAGIDAIVNGLLTLEGVVVTVVAPAEQQSGTGGSTTDGPLTVVDATTASGYPAKAVQGFPADSVIWALDQGGIDFVPDLVVSGINEGQNIGPLVDVSGTVGAARAAASRGIPALATSQGLGNETVETDYASGVQVVLDFITEHVQDIADFEPGDPVDVVLSINIPTCVNGGKLAGAIEVPLSDDLGDEGVDVVAGIDCNSTLEHPVDDVDAFVNGFAAITPTPIEPMTAG